MNSMDIFYDSDWIDFQEQISIRKVLKAEHLSIYYITLPELKIRLRFDNRADETTKLWNHTTCVPSRYPKTWYEYIVKEIADLRMCEEEEVMELLFYLGDIKDYDGDYTEDITDPNHTKLQ